jgi:F0F1-type ATP synthase delta subunit
MNSSDALVNRLLSVLFTTTVVKQISDILEELSQNKTFKRQANHIITDSSLTDKQKQAQLMFLIKTIQCPELIGFFEEAMAQGSLWLFSSDKIDYFDRFVQNFQLATETLKIVYLVTAVNLSPLFLKTVAQDLGQSFGYKVIIDHQINPDILGGTQVRVENMVFDRSLKKKFQHFQAKWLSTFDRTEKKLGYHQVDEE